MSAIVHYGDIMLDLVNEEDMVPSRKKDKEDKKINKGYDDNKNKLDRDNDKEETRRVVKRKPEKPVRILRIKYYSRITFPFMEDDKIKQKEAFAVDRSLEDLLKALYYNTGLQENVAPTGCIFVEKDEYRMSANEKFIFINIATNEFYYLKRQLENHITIVAFNKGEFSILDGKRSSLTETFNIPRIWIRDESKDEKEREISDTNIILMRARLREELKEDFRPYHSYTDERIDAMKEIDLVALKKLSKRKRAIDDKKIKDIKKLLKQ